MAGDGAYWLFTLGLIGTGMLGVPVLVGSCAYAISEATPWRGPLDRQPRSAPKFCAVVGVAMVIGLALNYVGLNAVRMLFWTVVIYRCVGAAADSTGHFIDQRSQGEGERTNPPLLRGLGWFTFVVMAVAAAGMFVTS